MHLEINYQQLLNESMISLVKKILVKVSEYENLGEHYFYISFKTNYSGVKISKRIKARYPDEITIVLQYQFEKLKISPDKFTVKISFDGIPENIEVPFAALTAFADPSVKFGIQIQPVSARPDKMNPLTHSAAIAKVLNNQNNELPQINIDNVIRLDKFRPKSNNS